MTIAMNAAFACELVMKAICLTWFYGARKTHDLAMLFMDLPDDSKGRLEQDFPELRTTMENSRHTFGKWRYFEVNVGDSRIKPMVDTLRAFDLAKAARVFLDEAQIMGIQYSMKITATQNNTMEPDGREFVHVKTNMNITGFEAPPRDT